MSFASKEAIREEWQRLGKSVKTFRVLIFLCTGCGAERAIRANAWSREHASEFCRKCSPLNRDVPHRPQYKAICRSAKHRGLEVTLTFEEFLAFLAVPACHYCNKAIDWSNRRRANLDRKDNSQGYAKENCVVCCKKCNFLKADRLTYDQMMRLAPTLQQFVFEGQY